MLAEPKKTVLGILAVVAVLCTIWALTSFPVPGMPRSDPGSTTSTPVDDSQLTSRLTSGSDVDALKAEISLLKMRVNELVAGVKQLPEKIAALQPPPPVATAEAKHHPLATTYVCPEYWEPEEYDERPGINFPIATTTRKLDVKSIDDLPLFKHILPSIAATVEPEYRYSVYLGIDKGDPFLDKCENMKQMRAAWRKLLAPYNAKVPLQFLVYGNTASRNTWATNYATLEAYNRGWEYFYRVNDDTIIKSPKWATEFIKTMRDFKPVPFLGCVAPMDPNYAGVATHSFVHRRHWEAFGFHFPYLLGNGWSDDWIGQVYKAPWGGDAAPWLPADAVMSVLRQDVEVKHMVIPMRYNVTASYETYMKQLDIDKRVLYNYIKKFFTKRHAAAERED